MKMLLIILFFFTTAALWAQCQNPGIEALEIVPISAAEKTISVADGGHANVNGDELSIRAKVCGAVARVVFFQDGLEVQNENVAPFYINGDRDSVPNAWQPGTGRHIVRAVPYGGNGQPGKSYFISLTVSGQQARPCDPLTLMDELRNHQLGHLAQAFGEATLQAAVSGFSYDAINGRGELVFSTKGEVLIKTNSFILQRKFADDKVYLIIID